MKKNLGADAIIANVRKLKGFTTKRQVAAFFRVCPSAVTDWTNRKGYSIPAKRLAEASLRHGIRWQWLACGEGAPYEEASGGAADPASLAPDELELLARVKASPQFSRAVEKMLCLDEERLKLIARLAESMAGQCTAENTKNGAQSTPFITWKASHPLTAPK